MPTLNATVDYFLVAILKYDILTTPTYYDLPAAVKFQLTQRGFIKFCIKREAMQSGHSLSNMIYPLLIALFHASQPPVSLSHTWH